MQVRKAKKILVIAIILTGILWFGGNGLLYYLISSVFAPVDMRDIINSEPESLALHETTEGMPIDLFGVRFNYPYSKNEFLSIYPMFFDNELHTVSMVMKSNDTRFIMDISKLPKDYYQLMSDIYASKISDYSYWNLPHNYELGQRLFLKNMSAGDSKRFNLFNVTTPAFNGKMAIKDRQILLYFPHGNNTIGITFTGGLNIESANKIIASIRSISTPLDDGNPTVNSTACPDELRLISEISMHGINGKRKLDLLRVMEMKGVSNDIIEHVRQVATEM